MEQGILFLGTGGDSVVVGKQLRRSGGVILNIDDYQFHINPGPGALLGLNQTGVNVRETSVVFVSNLRQINSAETMSLIEAMTLNGLDTRGVLVCNDNSLKGSHEHLPIASVHHKNMIERLIVMEENQKLGIGSIEIHALPTRNSIESIGFKFITEGFTISYLPDTNYSAKFKEALVQTDILILNVAAPFGFELEDHLNCEDVVKILDEVKPKLAILTGFGIKMLKEDIRLQAREIHKQTMVQVIAAQDGMIINPKSYVTSRAQKRLQNF